MVLCVCGGGGGGGEDRYFVRLKFNSLSLTVQVPPFWQGCGEQSSMFISQLVPVHPSTHVQMYIATSSCVCVCVCV